MPKPGLIMGILPDAKISEFLQDQKGIIIFVLDFVSFSDECHIVLVFLL